MTIQTDAVKTTAAERLASVTRLSCSTEKQGGQRYARNGSRSRSLLEAARFVKYGEAKCASPAMSVLDITVDMLNEEVVRPEDATAILLPLLPRLAALRYLDYADNRALGPMLLHWIVTDHLPRFLRAAGRSNLADILARIPEFKLEGSASTTPGVAEFYAATKAVGTARELTDAMMREIAGPNGINRDLAPLQSRGWEEAWSEAQIASGRSTGIGYLMDLTEAPAMRESSNSLSVKMVKDAFWSVYQAGVYVAFPPALEAAKTLRVRDLGMATDIIDAAHESLRSLRSETTASLVRLINRMIDCAGSEAKP